MGNSISVNLFGGLSVVAAGTTLLDSSAKINKPWQIFSYLVLNPGAPVSATKLLAALWTDEDLTDPANVLKNTVYALRREFKRATDMDNSPILFENGGYICNPAIEYEIDVNQFVFSCNEAKNKRGAEKLVLLQNAADLYKGDLLPQLEEEVWVMTQSVYLKKCFTECVLVLCNELNEQGKYSELLTAATNASRMDPLEEEYYIYLFRSLYSLNMHRVLIPAYHKVARLFAEEYGAPLGSEITEIYNLSCEKMNQIEQDIVLIKDDLREITFDNRPVNGALYCTYDVFKYLYRMIARSAERTGAHIMIVLLTMQMEDGAPVPSKLSATFMGRVKSLLLGGILRKSDTVARYSRTQYIVMLSTEKATAAQVVTKRIEKNCAAFLHPNGIKLIIATTELEVVGG